MYVSKWDFTNWTYLKPLFSKISFVITLTIHSFPAPSAIIMDSSSFDSPKPYPFALYLKNNIAALLRYAILAQTNPI